jgi:hypothetical protein
MNMRIEDAVRSFRDAATTKEEYGLPANRDHDLHETMSTAWRFLYSRGVEGREAFRQMLADPSPYVRLWVASQLLSEGDLEAVRVVEAEAGAAGLRGTSAKVVLAEWRAGRLGSPFGNI